MSRGTFRSKNKVGETMSFQTDSSSGTTFDPTVTFLSGSDRVSWDLGDGSGYNAGNSLSYTYPDTGTTKTVTLRTNLISRIISFESPLDNLISNLDMSGWDGLEKLVVNSNSITGVTLTQPTILQYGATTLINISSCDLTGNLDMTMYPNKLGGTFNVSYNPNLTGITHTASTTNLSSYQVNNCDITGIHDISMIGPLLGGTIRFNNNTNLTEIINPPSVTNQMSQYYGYNCDLTGNLNMSAYTKMGGAFKVENNPNLTGITHPTSTTVFNNYQANSCGLIGNHDVSMLPGLGGQFQIQSNTNLTSITHTASTETFSLYQANSCGLIGNHDVSMLPGLGGQFQIQSNTNLTGITHTASTETFSSYRAYSCNLTGNHDMSMLPGLGGIFYIYSNPLLTSITHPASTEVFSQYTAYSCGLDYVNFLPLSGASITGSIRLEENSMSVTDVNHILVDFDNISTNLNPAGWTGTTLDISGTNAAPDSSSGGFDGIAALSSLTGGTNNWTITTS